MATVKNGQEVVSELNSLLRGEISAAETYKQALDKMEHDAELAGRPEVAQLREIHTEHGKAAQKIRGRIRDLGGEASDSSGAWGAWAKTVEGAAKLFGDTSALKALKEGEEHGLKEYRDAADHPEFDTQTRALMSSLVKQQTRHLATLDCLLAAV